MQREWVARVLRLIPPGETVLDAPCGTGKYFPMLAAAGHPVAGADQSAGMLAKVRAQGIAFSLRHTSLQELSYADRFDAVLTIDAMQHIPPRPRASGSRAKHSMSARRDWNKRRCCCWHQDAYWRRSKAYASRVRPV
jgi:cyclopropane fatty-acyl-phospholipid synthase-like methyltransferase